MWSTYDPPDEIIETEPFDDIEAAFGICIDNDDDALELYNAYLRQAAEKIAEMQPKGPKGRTSFGKLRTKNESGKFDG